MATGFGAGWVPRGPGTAGTLLGAVAYVAAPALSLGWHLGVVVVLLVVGLGVSHLVVKDCGKEDPGFIVIDEIVGFWVVMVAIPKTAVWVVLGFVLFRIFDIVKPWPIPLIERRLKGGPGVMLDDFLAALMAWACLQGCYQAWMRWPLA